MQKYFVEVTPNTEVLGVFIYDDAEVTLSEPIPVKFVDVTSILSMTHDEVMLVLETRLRDQKLYFENGRFFNKDEFSFLP